MPVAQLSNELRHQLTTGLKNVNERKSRGCANIKAALQQLSQAETGCKNVEDDIKLIAKRLVGTTLSILWEVFGVMSNCERKKVMKYSHFNFFSLHLK